MVRFTSCCSCCSKTTKVPFRGSIGNIYYNQTLANWGPDSRFVLEAIFKALISKSSRSSIFNTPYGLHPITNSKPHLILNFHMCIQITKQITTILRLLFNNPFYSELIILSLAGILFQDLPSTSRHANH